MRDTFCKKTRKKQGVGGPSCLRGRRPRTARWPGGSVGPPSGRCRWACPLERPPFSRGLPSCAYARPERKESPSAGRLSDRRGAGNFQRPAGQRGVCAAAMSAVFCPAARSSATRQTRSVSPSRVPPTGHAHQKGREEVFIPCHHCSGPPLSQPGVKPLRMKSVSTD